MTDSPIISASGQPFRTTVPQPYEAGGHGRRLRGMLSPGSGPDTASTANAQTLRNRSRQQYRNNGYAQNGINKLVSNIIGTGIKPRSTAKNKNFQKAAQALWAESGHEMDPAGLLDIYGIQAQAVNAWKQGGECFVRMRPRREADGLLVPMQLQVMEPELCPVYYNDKAASGNPIRHGIEYNVIGQRVAYWFYRSHPGDRSLISVDPFKLTRVPASEVIHLFDPVRPGQSRGSPQMAAVLLKMHDTEQYDDATLLRQQISNLFAAFVTNNTNQDGFPSTLAEGQSGTDPEAPLGLEPGIIQELLEGQNVEFSKPPDAGSTYVDFIRQQLRAISSGYDMPYELFSGDYSQINDRLLRGILNQFYRRVQQAQHHIVIHQLCRRIWSDWWMPRAILAGRLNAPGYANNPGNYTTAKHIPQAWAYLHPEQDVNAAIKQRRSGFKSRAQLISESSGQDIDDVDAEIAAEDARADEHDLIFDTDPRYTDSNGKRATDPHKAPSEDMTQDTSA